jgi:hypothetical protein
MQRPLPLCRAFCPVCGRGWCLPTARNPVADPNGHLSGKAVLLGGRRWLLVRRLDGEGRQAQELELEGLPYVGTVEENQLVPGIEYYIAGRVHVASFDPD